MENTDMDLQKQIDELKQQNKEMARWKEEMNDIAKVLPTAFKNINETMGINQDAINNISRNIFIIESYLEKSLNNREYELYDPRRKEMQKEYFYPNILSANAAIEQIIQNRKSMARFGDGEFELMSGKQRWAFQPLSDKLKMRLIEVIKSEESQLLIGIADNYGMLDAYSLEGASAIRAYMTPEVRAQHKEFLEKDKVYYDAYITRPYVMYADKETDAPRKRFEQLKKIWEGRNVIIVEGAQTRFGAGNDFLNEAASVRRILAPATNSFSRYEEILEATLKVADADDLCLVALGPCAGVLVYDLCVNGIQAIDVGHADLEYEWFLAGEGRRVRIPYKYSSEITGGENVEEFHDPIYQSQIIVNYGE